MFKTNKVVRVSFSGGLLGLIFGSARGKVETIVQKHNQDGWNVAEIIPDNPNLAIWIVRILLLIATLGLWTISSGYLFIMERPRSTGKPDVAGEAMRKEPRLSATR